jgi:hypothetical protein
MLESELARPTPLLLQQHYRKPKILFTQSRDETNRKALRGKYEVKIMKDEVKATLAVVCRGLSLSR